MTWDQIDFEKGTWTKPAAHTKQKKLHHVPFSAPALEILARDAGTRLEEGSSEYVFPGRDGVGHRVDLKKPWAAICKAASINGLRLHDLRHSYASILASGGTSLPMIGKLLGHTQAATTQRYAHLDVDPLREVDRAGRRRDQERRQVRWRGGEAAGAIDPPDGPRQGRRSACAGLWHLGITLTKQPTARPASGHRLPVGGWDRSKVLSHDCS